MLLCVIIEYNYSDFSYYLLEERSMRSLGKYLGGKGGGKKEKEMIVLSRIWIDIIWT